MAALLLATALFYDCLKMSSAQDLSSTLNRWSRESSGRKYTTWLASKWMAEWYMKKSWEPPSIELRMRLLQRLKKVIMARARLFRVPALKQSKASTQCL